MVVTWRHIYYYENPSSSVLLGHVQLDNAVIKRDSDRLTVLSQIDPFTISPELSDIDIWFAVIDSCILRSPELLPQQIILSRIRMDYEIVHCRVVTDDEVLPNSIIEFLNMTDRDIPWQQLLNNNGSILSMFIFQ